MNPKKYLENLFRKALEERSPSQAIEKALHFDGDTLSINGQSINIESQSLYVLAVGKAAVPMYEAMAQVLGNEIAGSLVITPNREQAEECGAEEVIAASHPTPDKSSLQGGKRAAAFFQEVSDNGLMLTLISGGTSSLMCLPAVGIPIGDLNKTFELLNNSGANIYEINAVRKHCSQIKGGQLLRYLPASAKVVNLVISDVPNDDLSVIGSGPTTLDSSTFDDAHQILQQYRLWDKVPKSVQTHIKKGLAGEVPETVKSEEDLLHEHQAHIISSAGQLAEKIAALASDDGYRSRVADRAYNDDVQQVANQIADQVSPVAEEAESSVSSTTSLFVFYGESTVDVTGSGKGGRNQELALRGALQIDGWENITWLSAGTDGIDGPTDAAGAIVDEETIPKARRQQIDPKPYLENNDAYHFHEKLETLLKTGPTGNNLMDVVLVLKQSE